MARADVAVVSFRGARAEIVLEPSRTSSALTSTGRVIRCALSRTLLNLAGVALIPMTRGMRDNPISGAPSINRWMMVRAVLSAFALSPIPLCASSTMRLKCAGDAFDVFSMVCQIVHVRPSPCLVSRPETPSFCLFRK